MIAFIAVGASGLLIGFAIGLQVQAAGAERRAKLWKERAGTYKALYEACVQDCLRATGVKRKDEQ